MGCGNQPVFTALKEGKDECDLTNKPSGAGGGFNPRTCSFLDDIMSLPFVSPGYEQFPACNIQGYETLPPDMSLRGHGTSMDYGKSETPMNFTPPRCETGNGYPMKTHGQDAQDSRISRFQMIGKYSSSECSTSLLPLVDNFGATGNPNDIRIGPLSSSLPQKIDRNFLTLGIGGDIEVSPNSIFSTREISNTLKEVSSQCNNLAAGHYPNNSNLTKLAGGDAGIQSDAGGLSRPDCDFHARKLPNELEEVSSQFDISSIENWRKKLKSLTQVSSRDAGFQPNAGGLSISNSNFHGQEISSKLEGATFPFNNSTIRHYPNPSNLMQLAGGSALIQTNAGGLSRSASNLASRMSTCVEGGLTGDTGFRMNSTPFPGLQIQKLQAAIPSNTPNYTSVSPSTPLSLPSGSTLTPQPKCSSQPEIASTDFASQPMSWQQDYSRKISTKLSSESSRNYLSDRHKQSPVSHVRPGAREGKGTDIAKTGSFRSSVHPVGHFGAFHNVSPIVAPGNYISSERISIPFSKRSNYQSAAAGCFPKRLGLQPNDFASAQSARGHQQHEMAAQSSAVFPNHSHGRVAPVSKVDLRPEVAPITSHPPLKRKAIADPSALPGQQRKTVPKHVRNYSTSQQRQKIQSIPTPPLHVKWKGCEEPLEPTGERCSLCKRDLSFTAEGAMYEPTAPPAVAVLPCGHTFHDHCLQIITPQDQSKNPPCIPCAVGET